MTPFNNWQNLTETIGYAAKQLYLTQRFNAGHHKMFVFQTKEGFYTFDLYLTKNKLIATLTVMTDNRVKVDYHGNTKRQEILYL